MRGVDAVHNLFPYNRSAPQENKGTKTYPNPFVLVEENSRLY
jgi:hypothetical protein